MKKLLVALSISLLAVPAAFAQDGAIWSFKAAQMGQYEGGVTLPDQSAGISYDCSSLGTHLTFWAQGMHIAPGETRILVDGAVVEVARPQAGYLSLDDRTTQAFDVPAGYGQRMKDEINSVISALAGGEEVVWLTPSGDRFTFPLKGSEKISRCKR